MSATVSFTIDDGVAVITLDDPDVRNAISLRMADELGAAVDELEADPAVGALVVTGAGGAFCAGADLAVLETAERTAYARIYAAFLRVARSPLPTIAAVNGAAAGAGMNLALACDLRLVSERARFLPRFLDLGLHPGGGHTWLLQRAAGRERALALLLTGVEPRGAEAVQWGLALRCVESPEQLVPEAIAMARRAAAHPRVLVERIKATVDAVAGLDELEAAVEVELDAQIWSANQQHFRDRVAAVRAAISGPPA